ncbi:homoserine/homoserine lactone efflux protein [Uliginosibacterium sp. sgz301328]|uniref:homoserine/homoserine lactone efflux protein n=1 Tax=Uliginosibacterium sp. sgz301328 TaxID=3243764 RepID=UPI00359F07C6
MPLHTWLAFFVASWLISLSPGPGALSCMTAGLRYGYRRAVWNIFGLQAGVVMLVTVVAAGLGAILAASAVAFDVVKWLGAAYLVWLGIQQWRASAGNDPLEAEVADSSRRNLVLRGFLVNASNPKGILFMLAVLPQFIDPNAPQWPQYAICAATLVATDMVVMSSYTLLASRVLRALRGRHARAVNRMFGGLFIGAGVLLASFRRG